MGSQNPNFELCYEEEEITEEGGMDACGAFLRDGHSDLNILSMNVCSFRKKHDQIAVLLCHLDQFDCLILTEAHIKKRGF